MTHARLASWNCRSLLHFRADRRKKKVRKVISLAAPNAAVALQEVRGTIPELEALLRPLAKTHTVFASLVHGASAGGVATLLPLVCRGALHARALVPGRVLRIVWKEGDKTWIHWNVHNFGLTDADLFRVEALLRCDIRDAAASPGDVSLFAAGDWNFTPDGAPRVFWIRAKGQGAGRPLTSVPQACHPNQMSCRTLPVFDTMLVLVSFVF